MRELREGDLLVLSRGNYDDYETLALARVLKPFTREQLKGSYPRQVRYDDLEIIGWLVDNGYVEITGAAELHLLIYGAWSDEEMGDFASVMRCSKCNEWARALDRDDGDDTMCRRCNMKAKAKGR